MSVSTANPMLKTTGNACIYPSSMADNQQWINNVPAFDALEVAIETFARDSGSEFADIITTLASIEARIETIEQSLALLSMKKKTGGSDDPLDRVTNSLLYTKYRWAAQEKFRANYLSEDVQAKLDNDSRVTKHHVNTKDRWHAEGHVFWHRCATLEQKNEIRNEYNHWRKERSSAQLPEPLVDNE